MKTKKFTYAVWLTVIAFMTALLGLTAVACGETEVKEEGPETGVYYYDAEGAEYLVTLFDVDKFTFYVRGENKHGTYALENTALTFTFSNGETLSATYESETLSLTYQNAQMCFLRKVNYTVAFESNGGSKVDNLSVLNGKTVAKPADPTLEGNVFLGWYSDAALTKAFNFTTEIVTADITLYARWAQTVVGQAEFTVDFDLNYDGAQQLASANTIGGKLYNTPTPVREGYTFAGWWVSMYQDANKLSYVHTEDLVFDANTTLFAVWQKNGETPAPLVSVSATSVSWESLGINVSYVYEVTGPNGDVIANERDGSTSHSINFSALPAGDYVVRVTANSQTTVRYYKNKALARVSQFSVIEPATLVFNEVAGAQKYYITVECGNPDHNHVNYDNGKSTNFNFADCSMKEGGIRFTVTAVADGYASSTSDVFVYDRLLAKVSGFRFDEATETLYWNAVPNAAGYSVSVTYPGEADAYVNIGNKTSYSLKDYSAGSLTVKVVPHTNGYNSPAAAEYNYAKKTLATPTNIRIVGTTLFWDEVDGATGYNVRIGGQTLTTQTNQIELADVVAWVKGEDYMLTIRATGSANSAWSDEIDVRYYAMYASIAYAKNVLSWRLVVGATQYQVSLNGTVIATVLNGVNYVTIENLTQAGENTLAVRFYDGSAYSEWAETTVYAYTITFDSRSGLPVAPVYRARGDKFNLPTTQREGYDFSGWYNTPQGAAGNGKAYDGETFEGASDLTLYAFWLPRGYTVTYDYGQYGTGAVSKRIVFNDYYVLDVPTTNSAEGIVAFAGWFSDEGGKGTQYTDENGVSLAPWTIANNVTVYAKWDEILSYTKLSDGTYSVTKGPGITLVDHVRIPDKFNDGTGEGKVSTLKSGAFKNNKGLVRIDMPNTILYNEAESFTSTSSPFYGCTGLLEVNVYDAGQIHPEYLSVDGVLLRASSTEGTYQLVYFPQAKGGIYEIPATVEIVRASVFSNRNITELVIPDTVKVIEASAFASCKLLAKVTINPFVAGPLLDENGNVITDENGDPIYKSEELTIYEKAFQGCSALVEVTIPKRAILASGATIQSVFQNCNMLEKIYVEEGHDTLTDIDGVLTNKEKTEILYAPKGLAGLYEIPVGVTSIGANAFESCTKLTEVIIPGWVQNVGNYAFQSCTNLLRVTFQGVGAVNECSIGQYAFASCSKLAAVSFEAGSKVASIGANAFRSCSALTSITFPASLKSVGASAFYSCRGLTTITFEESDNTITFGSNAFQNCSGLVEIFLPKNVSGFNSSAFSGCTNLAHIYVDSDNEYLTDLDGVLYTKDLTEIYFFPKGYVGAYVLPDQVVTVPASTFYQSYKLTSVSFGPNVETIGANALRYCSALTEVIFRTNEDGSSALKSIGNYAFANTALTKATIKAGIEYGDSVYSNSPIETATIEHGVTTVPNNVFQNCTSLTEINIPNTVTYIGASAFNGCTLLNSVTFEPNGTEELTYSTSVFQGTTSLATITLPARSHFAGLSGSGSNANFFAQSALEEVYLEDGINMETISANFFYSCTNLKSFTVPKSVKEIGASAFYNCISLTSLTFEDGGTEGLRINDWTASMTMAANNLTELHFPARLTYLGAYFIYNLGGLQTVTFENGTEPLTIGNSNFYNTTANPSALTTLELPDNLKSVGTNFLYNAALLTSVELPDNLETIGNYSFSGCSSLTEIHFGPKLSSYSTGLTGSSPASTFENTTSLRAFTVDPANEYFTAKDGALYDKNMTTLLLYAKAKEGPFEVPNTVTMISAKAFAGTTGLTKLTFEAGGDPLTIYNTSSTTYSPFYQSSIQYIKLPARIDKIADYLFYYCQSLKEVELEDGCNITEIGKYAFYYCSSLESFTVPGTVTTIGATAFYRCSSLRDLIFEDGTADLTFAAATSYSYATFGYSGIVNIMLPARLTTLGAYAFYNAMSLETVAFEEGAKLTTFGTAIFQNSSLRSIVIPDSVTSLGTNTFNNCTALTSVTLPANWNDTFNVNIFTNCSSLAVLKIADSNAKYKTVDNVLYDKDMTTLYHYPAGKTTSVFTIPSTVTTIGANAFSSRSGTSLTTTYIAPTYLTKLIIPTSVTTINNYAFSDMPVLKEVEFIGGSANALKISGNYVFANCRALESVILPTRLSSIGTYLFAACTSLSSVTFENNKTNMSAFGGNYMFQYCTALKSFTFPEGVTSISGTYLFAGSTATASTPQSGLESIVIPAGIKSLSNYMFQNCSKLTSVTLPESLTSLGTYAFYNCSALTSIKLPANLTEIGNYSFYGSGLTTIDIPNNVTSIGTAAFFNCTALDGVVIPDKVTSIGNTAFSGCSSLTSVNFQAGGTANLAIGTYTTGTSKTSVFAGTKLEEVILPARTTAIGNYAFAELSTLRTVIIEEGGGAALTIGTYAFQATPNLAYVSLPSNLTTIGTYAFQGAAKVEVLEVPAAVTVINPYTFANMTELKNITLYDGITKIDNYAFAGDSKITNLVIPGTVTTLGTNPFQGVPAIDMSGLNTSFAMDDGVLYNAAMTSLLYFPSAKEGAYVIPDTVTSLGAGVFNGSSISSITLPVAIESIAADSFKNSKLQTFTVGRYVTSIGANAFEGCTELREVIFEDGRQSNITIGNYAFKGCTSLATIALPDTVTTIATGLFQNSGIKSFTVGKGIASVGQYAFQNSAIEEVTFEKGGTKAIYLGLSSFQNTALKSVEIPYRTRSTTDSSFSAICGVGNYAFANCAALKSVTVAERGEGEPVVSGKLTVGTWAFQNCTNLETVSFSEMLSDYTYHTDSGDSTQNALSSYAFDGCVALESITFSSPVSAAVSWGSYVFRNCVSLKEISFPAGLTTVPMYAFQGAGLEEVVLPTHIRTASNYAFAEMPNLKSVKILSTSMTYISSNTFMNDAKLETVELPNSLTSIYSYAFSGCTSLANITLPSTLMTINSYAFENCTSISHLVIPSRVSTVSANAFYGWQRSQKISVQGKTADSLPSGWNADWAAGCYATIEYI